MNYKLMSWSINSTTNITPKPGPYDEFQKYVIFDVPDLSAIPYTYIYKSPNSPSEGNSVEIVADFDDCGTSSKLYLVIDDGLHREGIYIHNSSVSIINTSTVIPVTNPAGEQHRYTITLDESTFTVYFDRKIIYTGAASTESTKANMYVGFIESQTGKAIVKFSFIKDTKGIFRYIIPEDTDFELQIDSSPKFDSINLKTYTKQDFISVPENKDQWSPVSYICGNFINGVYDGKGIVQSVTIQLPEKPDAEMPIFYYRVREKYNDIYTDYSCSWLDKSVRPKKTDIIPVTVSLLDTSVGNTINDSGELLINADDTDKEAIKNRNVEEILDESDAGYFPISPTSENAGIVLPETPLPDLWSVDIYNASDKTVTVYDHIGNSMLKIGPWQINRYEYSITDNIWKTSILQKQGSFSLFPNVTSVVFDSVFNYHIPSYDEVYTKAYGSGNVASIVNAEAAEIDKMYETQKQLSMNVGSFVADRDAFNKKWSNIFSLDKSVFRNAVEMRDAFQVMIQNLQYQTLSRSIEDIIKAVTGVKPEIIEYKNKLFNVLWSKEERERLPLNKRYYLFDPEHPNLEMNPFILYGGADKQFTWQINIFDTFNIGVNKELVKQIISLFKPAWTKAIIVFYTPEGVPEETKYFYGTSDYLNSSYNR